MINKNGIEIKRAKGSSLFRVTELSYKAKLVIDNPLLKRDDIVLKLDNIPISILGSNNAVANYLCTYVIKTIEFDPSEKHQEQAATKHKERMLAKNKSPEKQLHKRTHDQAYQQLKRQQEQEDKVKIIIPFTELGLDTPTGPKSEQLSNYTKAEDDREIILAYHAQFPFGYHITTV